MPPATASISGAERHASANGSAACGGRRRRCCCARPCAGRKGGTRRLHPFDGVGGRPEQRPPRAAPTGISGVIDSRTGERFPHTRRVRGTTWLVTKSQGRGRGGETAALRRHRCRPRGHGGRPLARVAGARGIPFRCVKGVSDGLGESLIDFNAFITSEGRFEFGRFALFAALRPWRWPALLRIGKNSRDSAACLRDSLLGILQHDR